MGCLTCCCSANDFADRIDQTNFFREAGLQEMSSLLSGTQISVTLLGTRIITSDTLPGSYSVKEFAEKVLEAGARGFNEGNLRTNQRLAGIDLIERLTVIYAEGDTKIAHANIITRILVWLREFSILPNTIRVKVEDHEMGMFVKYRAEEFNRLFNTSYDPRDDVIANREQIRNLPTNQ